ncbi:glycine-rich domain-containing protein [Actinokineospora sp.]|uniref:glycine-rich domain-containing protein n=1 Tax=Actinokineospora sp. TaxID=1872133 RepID=UPI003D6B75D4
MTGAIEGTTGRSLVPEKLFTRLCARVERDGHHPPVRASRIVDQALAFLATCGRNLGEPLAPSAIVDEGWHAFLLHTREYAEFCRMVAGRFIHHRPGDGIRRAEIDIKRSVRAMRAAGFAVDIPLWLPTEVSAAHQSAPAPAAAHRRPGVGRSTTAG